MAYDSPDQVRARQERAASLDPKARLALHESGQWPLKPEETVQPASSVVTINANGDRQFKPGTSLEQVERDEHGRITAATVVTQNGTRWRYVEGQDTVQLVGSNGQVIGQAPVEQQQEPSPGQAPVPGQVPAFDAVRVGETNVRPVGQADGVEVHLGEDGRVYWQHGEDWKVYPEGEYPETIQTPAGPLVYVGLVGDEPAYRSSQFGLVVFRGGRWVPVSG